MQPTMAPLLVLGFPQAPRPSPARPKGELPGGLRGTDDLPRPTSSSSSAASQGELPGSLLRSPARPARAPRGWHPQPPAPRLPHMTDGLPGHPRPSSAPHDVRGRFPLLQRRLPSIHEAEGVPPRRPRLPAGPTRPLLVPKASSPAGSIGPTSPSPALTSSTKPEAILSRLPAPTEAPQLEADEPSCSSSARHPQRPTSPPARPRLATRPTSPPARPRLATKATASFLCSTGMPSCSSSASPTKAPRPSSAPQRRRPQLVQHELREAGKLPAPRASPASPTAAAGVSPSRSSAPQRP